MHGAALQDRHHTDQDIAIAQNEATEVARLLMQAGVDHASGLWFQLLELGTQQACDWAERSAAAGAPLAPRGAALLGLRSLATELLATEGPQAEAARDAADACLAVCLAQEYVSSHLPPRQRRWGEGAAPQPPHHPDLLEARAGCC